MKIRNLVVVLFLGCFFTLSLYSQEDSSKTLGSLKYIPEIYKNLDSSANPGIRQIDLGTNLALPLSNNFKDARFNPNFAARALFSTSNSIFTFSIPLEIATQSINPELGFRQNFLYYVLPERSTFMIRAMPTYRSSILPFSNGIKLPFGCSLIIETDAIFMLKVFAVNRSTIFDTRNVTFMQASLRPHFLWEPDKDTYIDVFAGFTFIDAIDGRSGFTDVFLAGAKSLNTYFEFGLRSSFPKQKIIMDLQFIFITEALNTLLLGDTTVYPKIGISVNKDIFNFGGN